MRKTAANVEMQGIEFQIVNDSAEASKGLDELAKSLKALKSSLGSSGTQLDKVANGVQAIKNAINDVKLSSFESGMRRISDSLKPLGEMKFTSVTSFLKQLNNASAENLGKIAAIDFSNLKEAATDAKAISSVSSISSAVKNTGNGLPPLTDMGTVEIPAQTATMSQEFEETRRKAEELKDTIGSTNSVDAFIKSKSDVDILSMKLDEVKGKIADLRKEGGDNAPGLASLVERAQKLQEQIDNVGKSTEKTNSRFKDFLKSLKRIAMYRAVRSVISGITSSVKEGIQNLAQYSAAINSTDTWQANKTMSEYASTLQHVKNTIGSAVMPVLNSLLPLINSIADAFMNAVNAINQFFSALSGKSTFTKATKNAVDYAGSLSGATSAAKELKRTVMGFDELNLLNDNSSSGSGSGGSGGTNYGDMFEEVEIDQNVVDTMQTILDIAGAVGLALLDWKIATSFLDAIEKIKELKSKNISYSILFKIAGLGLFLDSWERLKAAVKDLVDNGPTFDNVIEIISAFTEGLAAVSLSAGQTKLAAIALLVSSVTGIIKDIKDMVENGPNWDNATDLVKQLGLFVSSISLYLGNTQIAGVSLMVAGIAEIANNLADAIEAIKKGDYTDTAVIATAAGALMAVAGFIMAIKQVKEKIESPSDAKTALDTVTQSTETLSTGTSTMTTKMKDLAKNIGLGVVILAEVAAGVIIFAGAIAVLGWELDKVGQAWQPVIDNAATVATAVGIGTGLMVAIGAACYGLGTLGGTAALNIGIGAAILVEIGAATLLFIAEVWAIGEGLQKVLESWKPVLNEGESVKSAIVTGTALLVGVGLVTAALGVASVASYGLLPAAILIGVDVLEKLGAAFKQLVKQLTTVADELSKKLAPTLDDANDVLPELKKDMSDFTEFMSDFAEEITDYTGSMGSITWDSIVGAFQKLFSKSPIKSFANSVEDIKEDTVYLQGKLTAANAELTTAVTLMTSYNALMEQLHAAMNGESEVNLPTQIFANMLEVGEQMVLGLVEGIENMRPTYTQKIEAFKQILVKNFNEASTSACSAIQRIIDKLNAIPRNVTTTVNTISTQTTSGTKTKKYAAGGFPSTGELFVAREAGAEMVGSIGGRTAVANNDQIVSAIKAGVYEAVASAMNNNKSDGGKQELHVYLDSKEISAGMNRRNRMYGAALAGT